MPRFRNVEVYPMSGWWGAPWVEDDRDGDAFAKVSRGVCDLYSSALATAGQQHTVSSLRIFIAERGADLTRDASDESQLVVFSPTHTDRVFEGFEQAAVRVPSGFAALDLDEQRRIVLDAVHAAAQDMAQFRALELAPFEQARAAVLQAGYVFTWSSDWKSSPGRRWRARCSFRTMADGFGRLILEVSTPDGSVSATSSEQISWTTMESYKRAAKTLHWTAVDRVEVIPWIDWLGYNTGVFAVGVIADSPTELRLQALELPGVFASLAASRHDAVEASELMPDVAGEPTPAETPVTVSLVVPDLTARAIHVIGGGPTNYVPEQYWRTLHALFDQLREDDWQTWWAPADLPILEVWWSAAVDEIRLFVRRSKKKVIARIERTRGSLRNADPVQAARDDLAALMAAVQRRMGLARAPMLR